MAKVTSKYQVTIPKGIAEKYNIRPGDEVAWVEAGEVIRVIPARQDAPGDEGIPSASVRSGDRPYPEEAIQSAASPVAG